MKGGRRPGIAQFLSCQLSEAKQSKYLDGGPGLRPWAGHCQSLILSHFQESLPLALPDPNPVIKLSKRELKPLSSDTLTLNMMLCPDVCLMTISPIGRLFSGFSFTLCGSYPQEQGPKLPMNKQRGLARGSVLNLPLKYTPPLEKEQEACSTLETCNTLFLPYSPSFCEKPKKE